MDVDAIRDVFFDDNLQSALSEHFGDGLFIWRTNFLSRVKAPDRTSGITIAISKTAMRRSISLTPVITSAFWWR